VISESVSLLDRIGTLIASDKLTLPVFDQIALRMRELAADKNCPVTKVEELITQDQALAAEVLRAANSPFYCGLSTIRTIRTAIVRLGVDQVTRLVCLASQYSKYKARDAQLTAMLQELWRHSSTTALAAQWLAKRLRSEEMEEECFLGGLLHDIGKLLILRAVDEINHLEGRGVVVSPPLIQEVLVAAHTKLGNDLLRRWNIPEIYCRIALSHHEEEFDGTDLTLAIVRLANDASRKIGTGLDPDPTLVLSSTPEAHILKISDVVLAELEVMLEDHVEMPA
jgi:putative nucleotidyltransferase with HDIG domain